MFYCFAWVFPFTNCYARCIPQWVWNAWGNKKIIKIPLGSKCRIIYREKKNWLDCIIIKMAQNNTEMLSKLRANCGEVNCSHWLHHQLTFNSQRNVCSRFHLKQCTTTKIIAQRWRPFVHLISGLSHQSERCK